jgi:triosephosphate isomerase
VRRPLIAANWKMHLGRIEQALPLVRRIRPGLSRISSVEVVLCPPATVLAALAEVVAASPIALGVQNLHWHESGPHTGEISAPMVAGLCRYAIVGHSERRASGGTGEDDRAVNRKLRTALDHGLVPIVCVGASLEQHRTGCGDEVVADQVASGLDGLETDQVSRCVIAYEPIWAIGSGQPATPVDANRTIALAVRGRVAVLAGETAARAVRVLYGGSVDVDNIAAFMAMPEIDGALVGGASLDEGFIELVRNAAGARHPVRH